MSSPGMKRSRASVEVASASAVQVTMSMPAPPRAMYPPVSSPLAVATVTRGNPTGPMAL